jgi:transcriptional regulator with XRE-family HTH domain
MSSEFKTNSYEFEGCVRIQFMRSEDDFTTWLLREIDSRGWSYADLARESGLSPGSIGNVARRTRKPGIEFCEAVARAFNYPLDVVLAAAGRGDKKPESEKRSLLEHMFDMLPEGEQDDVLDYVRFKQEQWRREQAGQSGKPKPVTGELK